MVRGKFLNPRNDLAFKRIFKDLDTNEHDIKAIQLFFMQLPFFDKTKKDIETMTVREKWAYFFKYASETTEEDFAMIVGHDPVIRRA